MPRLPTLPLLSAAGSALLLLGCATERTVLSTDQRMGFSESWNQQVGDVSQIKEKFASGFEIKDGRPVATHNKLNDLAGREFSITEVDRRGIRARDRQSDLTSSGFDGESRRFLSKPFAARNDPASETGRKAYDATRDASLPGPFDTGAAWSGSTDNFGTSGMRSSERRFGFLGENRQSSEDRGGERVDARVSMRRPGDDPSASLSVDEVRRMLHPGDY